MLFAFPAEAGLHLPKVKSGPVTPALDGTPYRADAISVPADSANFIDFWY